MPKNISKELEVAICSLSQKEKDRLLLRLINKNDLLTEQLQYKLLETSDDLVYRKADINDAIDEKLSEELRYPTQLMWAVQSLNAKVTRHRRATLDKYGEVELGIYLIKSVLEKHSNFLDILSSRTEKLSVYLVKRTLTILKNLYKLDQDFWIDFESDMNTILEILHTKITRIPARELQLPRAMETE